MNKNRGFILIECLTYLSLVFIIMGSVATSYFYIQKDLKLQGNYLYDIKRSMTAGEKFKNDVRKADRVLEKFLDKKSSDSTLILEGKEIIIYQLEKNIIYRYVYTGKNRPCKIEFMNHVKRIDFKRTKHSNMQIIEFEIELKARSKEMKTKPVFVFSETLGFGGRYVR